MTYVLRHFFALSILSFASFIFSLQPRPAYAIIGGITGIVPLTIAGGASVQGSKLTMSGGFEAWWSKILEKKEQAEIAGKSVRLVGIVLAIAGFILLDEEQDSYSFQILSPDLQQKLGLTDIEFSSYNAAIENGQIEEIFQEATFELNGIAKPTWDFAKNLMGGWLSLLDPNARSAFGKIAVQLVQE